MAVIFTHRYTLINPKSYQQEVLDQYNMLGYYSTSGLSSTEKGIESLPSTLALAGCSNTNTTRPDYVPTSAVSPWSLTPTHSPRCLITSRNIMLTVVLQYNLN